MLQIGLTLLAPTILCPALLDLPRPELEPRLAWGCGGLLALAAALAEGHAWHGPFAAPLLQAGMALVPRTLTVLAGAVLLGLAAGRRVWPAPPGRVGRACAGRSPAWGSSPVAWRWRRCSAPCSTAARPGTRAPGHPWLNPTVG